MQIEIIDLPGGLTAIRLDGGTQLLKGMPEHGLRDLEAELARRRAMGKTCGQENGDHTCALAPGDSHLRHLCRACTFEWPRGDAGHVGQEPAG